MKHYEDKTLLCRECGNEFVFEAGEQEFYAEKGFDNDPVRCKECRSKIKNSRRNRELSYEGIANGNIEKGFLQGNMDIDEKNSTSLLLNFHNIKGISGKLEIPLKNDVYGIVGNNGTGKSTIISLLSEYVPPYQLRLTNLDYADDSVVSLSVYNQINTRKFVNNRFDKVYSVNDGIRFNGRYEGSLFFGRRFDNLKDVDSLIFEGKIKPEDMVEADEFVVKKMGYILHNDENYYKLKRLRRETVRNYKLKNTAYFYDINGKLINQYRMSSGECLLLSLLHFLYYSVLEKSIPADKHALLLIDEIELALHPIATKRLIELVKEISNTSNNLTSIVSSHSLEVIRSIPANNLFNLKIESTDNIKKVVFVENPIYPCYLMKDIYSHNGFDFVILVEDGLASKIVDKALLKLKLRQNRLINITIAGGWTNIFDLHKSLERENTLGLSTKVISIIDGDVKSDAGKKFKNLCHTFLPIESVEKFLLSNLVNNKNSEIKKYIKDTIFTGVKSIDEFVRGYLEKEESTKKRYKKSGIEFEPDKNGKRLYGELKNFCDSERKISEDKLIDILFNAIELYVDLSSFEKKLTEIIK